MAIVKKYLTNNPCYRKPKKITPKGLMLHSVGCPQPKASVFMKTYNTSNHVVCVHGFIDGNNGTVYQCLPWNYRAYHCGGSANNTHIGIEMCEPSSIKYISGSNFTVKNKKEAAKCCKRTYNAAVSLFAKLCKEYKLNPLKKGVIISHNEGHDLGKASNHGDPEHLWRGLGLNYTMAKFRKDVKAKMSGTTTTTKTAAKTIKVGSKVKVKKGAKTYEGKELSSFVYTRTHVVKSISKDRVVITYGGDVVAAVKKSDLTLV